MATTYEKFTLHTHVYVIYVTNYQFSLLPWSKPKVQEKYRVEQFPNQKAIDALCSTTNVCYTKVKGEIATATAP
jgi:hypothetical protein